MIECLQASIDTKQDDELASRAIIIQRALVLLAEIHRATKNDPLAVSDLTKDLSKCKTVDGLLDLISLEGIYPCLSVGVGIPIERRVTSVLRNGVVTRASSSGNGPQFQGPSLLATTCLALDEILKDGVGLASHIQERTLVDLIAGYGELAYFHSVESTSSNSIYSYELKRLLDRYVLLQNKNVLPVIFRITIFRDQDKMSKKSPQDVYFHPPPRSHFSTSSRLS